MPQTGTEVSVTRQPIRPLSALVASQIAAGEVVERPASVVKELVDNAIDAGAARIEVELEQGGLELVRVTDDGAGIPAEELPLALAPHATSKIRDAADLDRVTTMGFRGEALASIASVSRLSIRSRTRSDHGASLIEAEGDLVRPVRPAPGPVGTSVSVRNLFFNTPARRKFVRTPPTEQGHCSDIVRALALAHPAVGFALRADGRVLFDVPPGQGPRERSLALLGREFETQYAEAHADQFDDTRGIALWGLVGLPVIARATPKGQHVFVNGRPVRDRTIQHALKDAYRGLIEPAKHPAAVLMIVLDPGAVDVNVHPAKAEVRFRDSGLVHSVVSRAVREALQRADLTPAVGSAPGPTPFADAFGSSFGAPPPRRFDFAAVREAADRDRASPVGWPPPRPTEQTPLPVVTPASRVLQVHNSYLVTQDEHGVLIIDQHALHERVMFERLRSRITEGDLESQSLLTPEVLDAPESRIETASAIAPLLRRLGIEVEPMGPRSLGVRAFPTLLFERGVAPGTFVEELLERAEEERWGDRRPAQADEEALHEVLDMMSCKAAIKAGDRMSEEELTDLLRQRDEVERSSNCPHGRPTSIRMTIDELERRFGRS